MSKDIPVDEKVRQKIENEISQCQARVAQTLVPTILAMGLLAVADPKNIRVVTLGCAFAVLFSSGTYVASLTYKIFRNASFLKVFVVAPWETALSKYRGNSVLNRFFWPIGSESCAAGAIYLALAATFFFIFYTVNRPASIVCTAILTMNALSIFLVYKRASKMDKAWEEVKLHLEEYFEEENSKS